MTLSDKIWWTKKARIQTEKRLLSNVFHSQLLLLWYSFFSVAVSIYYLKFNPQSEYANVAWVVFSVLVLSISSFINGFRFEERAGLIKECYEALGKLSEKSKEADNKTLENINNEYTQILGTCENHSEYDYYLAVFLLSQNKTNNIDKQLSKFENILLFIYCFRRCAMFIMLYILPIGLLWIMEAYNVSN